MGSVLSSPIQYGPVQISFNSVQQKLSENPVDWLMLSAIFIVTESKCIMYNMYLCYFVISIQLVLPIWKQKDLSVQMKLGKNLNQ